MTDKEQIINDEVDVSKCRFYKEGLCCLSYAFVENGYDCVECSECNDCDYKQLQRKTEECEELQHQIDKIKNYVKSNMFDVDCVNWFERFIYTFEDWKKSIVKNEDRYKQALDEIEKYQKRNCETCVFNKTDKCGISCQIFVILDIISKAKENK